MHPIHLLLATKSSKHARELALLPAPPLLTLALVYIRILLVNQPPRQEILESNLVLATTVAAASAATLQRRGTHFCHG